MTKMTEDQSEYECDICGCDVKPFKILCLDCKDGVPQEDYKEL